MSYFIRVVGFVLLFLMLSLQGHGWHAFRYSRHIDSKEETSKFPLLKEGIDYVATDGFILDSLSSFILPTDSDWLSAAVHVLGKEPKITVAPLLQDINHNCITIKGP